MKTVSKAPTPDPSEEGNATKAEHPQFPSWEGSGVGHPTQRKNQSKLSRNSDQFACWLVVVAFAVAMAWVESAVVFYLRTMVHRIEPYQENPLPLIGDLGAVELVREAATLVMLFTVGMLAGKTWPKRFGYVAIAFGVWDIFYYVFLKVMTGWPYSLADWDILFLLPLPWWGPVWAPMSIALLMIIWGTVASQFERPSAPLLSNWRVWVLNSIGIALALYVFMADAIRVSGQGVEAVRNVLPEKFNSLSFCIALALMSAPIVRQFALFREKTKEDRRLLFPLPPDGRSRVRELRNQ